MKKIIDIIYPPQKIKVRGHNTFLRKYARTVNRSMGVNILLISTFKELNF